MKLDEAIEVKETYLKGDEAVEHDKLIEADRISLEALKQMKAERTFYGFKRHVQMPGETKD